MKKKKVAYSHRLVCFDIETTHEVIDGYDVLYTWHWQATFREEGKDVEYFTFNSWDETLDKFVSWNDKDRLIVFVHNLSYEVESIMRNLCGHEMDEVFATDTHAIMKFVLDGQVEFRCSYRLTNKSLAECGRDVGIEKADMDYHMVRHPGDVLPEADEEYCKRDVLIMDAKIRQLEEQEGFHFWEFPLTNTGFLRNELRRAMKKDRRLWQHFFDTRLPYSYYMMLRDAFAGGYTHANYLYAGKVVDGVDSYDFGSAYPFAMLVHKFPMSSFHKVSNPTYKDIKFMLERDDVLFVCHVILRSTKGKVCCRTSNTFISFNKCITTQDVVLDNGRVQSATQIELTCTCLDFKIIQEVYDFDQIAVVQLIWANSGYLPPVILRTMLKYYEQKQKLKGIPGEEINYMKAKNRVNSFYGMMVTSIIHDDITIDGVDWKKDYVDYDDREVVQKRLDQFYMNRNNFLSYQWGVFVPAWTRFHLWHDIIIPNDRRIVYCDTDSAKMIDRESCLPAIFKYNKWAEDIRKKRLADLGYTEDFPDLGVFDWETEKTGAVRFITHGAKKYLTQDKTGKFHLTVAGLSKKAVQYIQSFDDFRPGTIFSENVSGRTTSHFLTNQVATYDNGGCWIESVTYRLSLSRDYERLLAERDGLTIEEIQQTYSDLYIDTDRRLHMGKIEALEDETVDLKVIRDKRNLFMVKGVKRYDEV